ncbi:MAG: hypothetical protein R3185_05120, partial [Candidatus Thermoplasmatota archaeon]|nr:hypothetical protein [Candidatus Thermoplasmatota archaeon]
PMAFEVEAGLEQAYVIGEEGDGFFTLFGPDDEVVDLVVLDEESEGAIWWDEDEHLIAVPVSLTEAGEHVVVLRSYDGGFLFLPDVTEAPEHRELELATTDVELEPSEEESSLFVVSESTAEGNTTLDSGLVGFTFESHLLETRNEVTLYGPDGDQVAGASSEFGGFYHEFCPDGQGFAAAGPAGAYHVVAEREGVFTGGNATVTLITYVR